MATPAPGLVGSTSRAFRWEDVSSLHALVSEKWRRGGPAVALHIGDLSWGMRPRPGRDPERDIRLWEDGGGHLAGFAWWSHTDSGDVIAHPDARVDIEDAMLEWFESEGAAQNATSFTTACFDSDEAGVSRLTARGYARTERFDPHLVISLKSPSAAPEPPDGYSLRNIEGSPEIEARAAVHRAAWSTWAPSALTTEVYEAVVRSPGYRQELDLVAVAGDGSFVSCTNVWYDEDVRVGEFEPVGCHPDHRRKGVTRALMLEGLRRLRDLGAEQAIVYTSSDNPGAQKLYESSGFRVADRYRYYTKTLP